MISVKYGINMDSRVHLNRIWRPGTLEETGVTGSGRDMYLVTEYISRYSHNVCRDTELFSTDTIVAIWYEDNWVDQVLCLHIMR